MLSRATTTSHQARGFPTRNAQERCILVTLVFARSAGRVRRDVRGHSIALRFLFPPQCDGVAPSILCSYCKRRRHTCNYLKYHKVCHLFTTIFESHIEIFVQMNVGERMEFRQYNPVKPKARYNKSIIQML